MLQMSTIPTSAATLGTRALVPILCSFAIVHRRPRRVTPARAVLRHARIGRLSELAVFGQRLRYLPRVGARAITSLRKGLRCADTKEWFYIRERGHFLRASLMCSVLGRYDEIWPHSDAVAAAARTVRVADSTHEARRASGHHCCPPISARLSRLFMACSVRCCDWEERSSDCMGMATLLKHEHPLVRRSALLPPPPAGRAPTSRALNSRVRCR